MFGRFASRYTGAMGTSRESRNPVPHGSDSAETACLREHEGRWVVEYLDAGGRKQHFHCATHAMALMFLRTFQKAGRVRDS